MFLMPHSASSRKIFGTRKGCNFSELPRIVATLVRNTIETTQLPGKSLANAARTSLYSVFQFVRHFRHETALTAAVRVFRLSGCKLCSSAKLSPLVEGSFLL